MTQREIEGRPWPTPTEPCPPWCIGATCEMQENDNGLFEREHTAMSFALRHESTDSEGDPHRTEFGVFVTEVTRLDPAPVRVTYQRPWLLACTSGDIRYTAHEAQMVANAASDFAAAGQMVQRWWEELAK